MLPGGCAHDVRGGKFEAVRTTASERISKHVNDVLFGSGKHIHLYGRWWIAWLGHDYH